MNSSESPRAPGSPDALEPKSPSRVRAVQWRRVLALAATAPVGWGLLRLGARHPELVEAWYSDALFPRVRGLLTQLSGFLPFSLAEAAIALGLLFVIWRVAGALRGLARGEREVVELASHTAASILLWCSLGYVVFLVTWGFNHARSSYEVHLGWERTEAELGTEPLAELVADLVEECNRLRPALSDEAFRMTWGRASSASPLVVGFESLSRELPALAGPAPVLRRLVSSPLFSRMGIAGIYGFFTAEAHVNGAPPVFTHPFSACHEVAHQRGFAREDEANFIAWQVCCRSGDPAYRYSASFTALGHAARALTRADPEVARALLAQRADVVRADFEASQRFWASQRTTLTTVVTRSNDLYLKSQGQQAGTASYGRMVELLLRERRQ